MSTGRPSSSSIIISLDDSKEKYKNGKKYYKIFDDYINLNTFRTERAKLVYERLRAKSLRNMHLWRRIVRCLLSLYETHREYCEQLKNEPISTKQSHEKILRVIRPKDVILARELASFFESKQTSINVIENRVNILLAKRTATCTTSDDDM